MKSVTNKDKVVLDRPKDISGRQWKKMYKEHRRGRKPLSRSQRRVIKEETNNPETSSLTEQSVENVVAVPVAEVDEVAKHFSE